MTDAPSILPTPPTATQPESGAAEFLLSNARYAVLIRPSGGGHSCFGDSLLTAWSGDPLEDRAGFFFYLRDLDSDAVWSMGRQPVARAARHYQATAWPRRFEIERLDHEIEARLEVCVPDEAPLEIRRVTLVNRSRRRRRIEITSYAEVVLNAREAHAAHPAFSRLFVQTECVDGDGTLLARRRPRGSEQHPWLAHALVGDGACEHETDRVRFVGRGRTLAAPEALAPGATLAGTTGNVIDPIVSLRRVVEIEPGATARLSFLLAADHDRESVLATIARWRAGGACDTELERAREAEREPLAVHGPFDAEDDRAASGIPRVRSAARAPVAEELVHWNGFGGFTPDGREYVIHLEHGPDGLRLPPRPWVNVLANEGFGALVSETGAGATWSGNSREQRITPWSNDPLLDPHGEALYVRDEASGALWSPLPGPIAGDGGYQVRHGFGATTFRHESGGLFHETVVFVASHEPVKIVRLRVENRADRPRELSLYCYQRLVLGTLPDLDGAGGIVTEIDQALAAMMARRPDAGPHAQRVAFAAAVAPAMAAASFTCDRAEFIGPGGGPDRPLAPRSGDALGARAGAGLDPCFAERVTLTVPARGVIETCFLLGDASGTDEAMALVERYRAPGAVERALGEALGGWRERLDGVTVSTPVPALDLVVNGWLAYQTLACRLWGRTAFYQSGGAFGFRDQLQDALALAWLDPTIARRQILLHAAHQFVEGDVLHWWHPPLDRGLRTRFADDLLWLPWLTATYLERTGDDGVLDETVPFLEARLLEPGEDEAFLQPERSSEAGVLYEHCCRAIDRSLPVGAHGLPLFGSGDWNDGMNRVGREGRGESVWMGFFLCAVLTDFDPVCARRGDTERRERYRLHRERLAAALDREAWDGDWYLRGWYDDGAPLGSHSSDECRIDALAQAWSVVSGVAPPERARRAMDAVERHLISEDDGLIRLLAPPFERTPHDPGYIKGYVAGVRENGGQYTHAALWVVQALAGLGRRDRAARLLEMLSPVSRSATADQVARYQVEPYVVAADVYGAPPHVGRGGWTWYTGSSGWMLRVALESVLGLTIERGEWLVVRPCVPDEWPGFKASLRIPGERTRYHVQVVNPRYRSAAVTEARLDGRPVEVTAGAARVPIVHDGLDHQVEIVLG